jgi:hypothetical protein
MSAFLEDEDYRATIRRRLFASWPASRAGRRCHRRHVERRGGGPKEGIWRAFRPDHRRAISRLAAIAAAAREAIDPSPEAGWVGPVIVAAGQLAAKNYHFSSTFAL